MFISPLDLGHNYKGFASLFNNLSNNLKGMIPMEHCSDHYFCVVCCLSLTMVDCV
jgi:hypothetical protein